MAFDNSAVFPIPRQDVNDRSGSHTRRDLAYVTSLAEFGSPLYVFDEATLRAMCRQFVSEFAVTVPQEQGAVCLEGLRELRDSATRN